MRTEELRQRVVVVGAGVSGCACAVGLAEAGVPVTLVGSALDVVGLPAYGPDVWITDPDAWARVPRRLRDVWERGAYLPDDGTPLIVIDRRAVSLGTKQLLEGLALVHLRQGLVVDVRPAGDDRRGVEVHTAFGDVIEGVACVLAVGLGLGGRVTEGERRVPGARYGEVAADALLDALGARGIQSRHVEREVGERTVGGDPSGVAPGDLPVGGRAIPLHRGPASTLSGLGLPGEGLVLPPGPCEFDPPGAPVAELAAPAEPAAAIATAPETAVAAEMATAPETAWAADTQVLPAAGMFPDGAVTGEWYRSPGYRSPECESPPDAHGHIVRLAHRVSGRVVVSLDPDGRLVGYASVWVVGQAAGACTYLDSLAGGSRVARLIGASTPGVDPTPSEGSLARRLRDDPGARLGGNPGAISGDGGS